jgi:uncharacterized protein (DUF305 family)
MTSIQDRREEAAAHPTPVVPDRALRIVLLAVIAVMALAAAAGLGYVVRGGSSSAALPGDSSVDAGFARDMMTHHEQAISMAIVAEHNSTDPEVTTLAFDIETSQTFQEGQMNGWLDSWHLSRQTSQPMMGWMSDSSMTMDGHAHSASATPSASASASASDPTGENTALMPGMATPAQITQLKNATGSAQDILFLQLMLRHHQGGITMAQDGVAHATEPYVRSLAQNMVTIQTREVVLMEQMLRARGAQPLNS